MKISILLFLLWASASWAASSPFKNLQQIQQDLGFDRLQSSTRSKVRVAVLDKGFRGLEKEIGKTLPSNTIYIEGPLAPPRDGETEHGLRMAQILTGLYSDDPARSKGLELYLYNVFGFTNFKAAVEDLIKKKVDVVLYSEVWEYGGNLDGRGFINAEVSKATRQGILWVNATGNFAQGTYNTPIKTIQENRVHLPNENYLLRVECSAPKDKTCPIRAVLSWNDFKDDVEEGTDKDLDFELVNSLFDRIASSSLRQTKDRLGQDPPPGASNYPRETIVAEIKPGNSYLKVQNISQNFGSKDQLRITIDGENVSIPSGDRTENILVPADNPEVISVGASDSERSGISLRTSKPEVLAPSSIILSDGNEFRGSSNSAAITAAAVALLKKQYPDLTRDEFLRTTRPFSWDQGGLSLQMLQFGPADRNCFQEGQWSSAPAHIRRILALGGKIVQTTHGWRIMLPYDPSLLSHGLHRSRADDVILSNPNGGFQVASRFGGNNSKSIEIFQRPQELGLCHPPIKTTGRLLSF